MKVSEDWSQLLSSLSQEQWAQMRQQIELATKAAQPWKPVPVQVAVKIELDEARAVSPEELYGALQQASGGALPLALEDLHALQAATPRLQDWVEASKEHAALLAVNPAAALQRADLGLDVQLVDRLSHLLRSSGVFEPDPAVAIDSVQLTVKRTQTSKTIKTGKEGSTHG